MAGKRSFAKVEDITRGVEKGGCRIRRSQAPWPEIRVRVTIHHVVRFENGGSYQLGLLAS